jgi:hypothetical protein
MLAGRFEGGCITLGTWDVGEKPFSLEVLVRPLSGRGPQQFVGWHGGGSDGALFFGRIGEAIRLTYANDSGLPSGRSCPADLYVGQWHHVVLVRDPRAVMVCVNGRTVVVANPTVHNLRTKDYPLIIGNERNGFAAFMGDIQFVRLYGDALTSYQVQALF